MFYIGKWGCPPQRSKVESEILIQEQTQQEILVHIIAILKITRDATQKTDRSQKVMDALQKTNEDMNILLNVTDVLT